MKNYIRVSKANEAKLPIRASTLYKWSHLRRYPEIFRKLGGFLFVDTNALHKLIEEGKPRIA